MAYEYNTELAEAIKELAEVKGEGADEGWKYVWYWVDEMGNDIVVEDDGDVEVFINGESVDLQWFYDGEMYKQEMVRTKQVYKNYCNAIQQSTGLQGKELSEAIAKANRLCYKVLFGNNNIRQKDMTPQQLHKLAQHREMMTSMMVMKANAR